MDPVALELFDLYTGKGPVQARILLALWQQRLFLSDFNTDAILTLAKKIALLPITTILFTFIYENSKVPGTANWVAVRTLYIDAHLTDLLASTPRPSQVVILGTGLDTRPFREISLLQNKRKVDQIFEVDFPGMLNARKKLFPKYTQLYEDDVITQCATDLSVDTWDADLINSGFDRTKPVIWILEGFTGYLTINELDSLLEKLTNLSVKGSGSGLVATWLSQMSGGRNALHRSECEDPGEFVGRYGWHVDDVATHKKSERFYREVVGMSWRSNKDYDFILSTHSI